MTSLMTKNNFDWMMAARADYKLAQIIKKLISREHLLLLRYTDKMSNDKTANDKTATDKISKDKTANDKMSNATKQLTTKCLMRQNV